VWVDGNATVLNGKQKAKDNLAVLRANNRAACLEGIWDSGSITPRSFMYRPIYPRRRAATEQVAE